MQTKHKMHDVTNTVSFTVFHDVFLFFFILFIVLISVIVSSQKAQPCSKLTTFVLLLGGRRNASAVSCMTCTFSNDDV